MEKISWTDRVKNQEELQTNKEERNIRQAIKMKKCNWIVHFLCTNCVLKLVIEGKISGKLERTGRRGGRHKELPNDFQETRKYWIALCRELTLEDSMDLS